MNYMQIAAFILGAEIVLELALEARDEAILNEKEYSEATEIILSANQASQNNELGLFKKF